MPFALIVEDEPDLGELFSLALESAGYEVRLLDRGEAAIALLAERIPDLLVLDLHMPEVTGWDVLKALKQQGNRDRVRVLVASADGHGAMQISDEVDLVLTKPVSYSQLRDLAIRLKPADPA